MTDPTPVVDAEPAPVPAPASAPLRLAERYPACFDWENPRPLKINIHQDWMAAGHDRIAVQRVLGRYGKADRYRRTLQSGATRIDWQGQPVGVVTEPEAAHARNALTRPPRRRPPRGPAAQRHPLAEGEPRTHGEILGPAPTPPNSGRPEDRHPDRGRDRHRDPAAEDLAPAGTGGAGRSALGSRAEQRDRSLSVAVALPGGVDLRGATDAGGGHPRAR